jgi:putative ABC transport system substrate-binding protein
MTRRTGLGFVIATCVLGLAGVVLLSGCSGSSANKAEAQSVLRVGLMHTGTDHNPPSLTALVARLGELGWFDGSPDRVMRELVGDETKVDDRMKQLRGRFKGSRIELIWRNLEPDQAPRQAREFVRDRVDVIVAFEDTSIRAAKVATARPGNRIPVVFLHPSDPVRDDLVKSRSRPGGNLTGVFGARDPVAKQLEYYKLLMPRLHRLLTLVDPTNQPSTGYLLAKARRAAAQLGIELVVRTASDDNGLARIFHGLRPGEVDGAFLLSPSLRLYHSAETIQLARKAGLPVQAHRKEWVEQGALFSLGVDVSPVGRAGARFVDSILRGADPADLPVEEVPKVEFALSLKTAQRLGIRVPQDLLVRADEVYR